MLSIELSEVLEYTYLPLAEPFTRGCRHLVGDLYLGLIPKGKAANMSCREINILTYFAVGAPGEVEVSDRILPEP